MPAAHPRRSLDELARLGGNVLEQRVKPLLRNEDKGKFLAIDVETGDFDIDEDDYTAVERLLARHPDADVWLTRAFEDATYRIARRQ
jgi:hypothetical protein